MLRHPRPPQPQRFTDDRKIATAKAHVRALFEAALPALAADDDGPSFPKTIDGKKSNLWGDYKAVFAQSQHGKCGYCELTVIGGQSGDVEHYNPKGSVRILDPDNQGTERENLSNISGRKSLRKFGTGYWWLAYAWDNYLLSCAICNQRWKIDFFPISGDPATRNRPLEGGNEIPLLLNPFDDDPGDHLKYDLDGNIRAKTERGLATIETVGLWRPSLVIKRRPIIELINRLIEEMGSGNDDLIRSHARTILAFGAPDWPDFPGLVRIFFRQQTGMAWDDLAQFAGG